MNGPGHWFGPGYRWPLVANKTGGGISVPLVVVVLAQTQIVRIQHIAPIRARSGGAKIFACSISATCWPSQVSIPLSSTVCRPSVTSTGSLSNLCLSIHHKSSRFVVVLLLVGAVCVPLSQHEHFDLSCFVCQRSVIKLGKGADKVI